MKCVNKLLRGTFFAPAIFPIILIKGTISFVCLINDFIALQPFYNLLMYTDMIVLIPCQRLKGILYIHPWFVCVHYEHGTCGNESPSFSTSFDEFKTFFIFVSNSFTAGTFSCSYPHPSPAKFLFLVKCIWLSSVWNCSAGNGVIALSVYLI